MCQTQSCVLMGLPGLRRHSQVEGWIKEPYLELQHPQNDTLSGSTGKIPPLRELWQGCFPLSPRWNGKKLFLFEGSITTTFSSRCGVRIHIICLAQNRPSDTQCEVVLCYVPTDDLQPQIQILCEEMTLSPALKNCHR